MKKIISSIAVVAVAFSMSAQAEQKQEMETINIEGLDSKNTTLTSLGQTGVNLLVNTGNLVIALNNNINALPDGLDKKADDLQKCIAENFEKFEKYDGDKPVTVAMCTVGSVVDAVGIVIEKTTGAAFRITAVPGKLLADAGSSLLADVAVVVDSMNDKDMTKIPGMWAYQLGYVIAAGSVGVVGEITGEMIQFISDKGQKTVELVINGVRTGIKVAHKGAVILVHYSIKAGKEVGERVVLVVGDALVSAIDTYSTLQCGLATGAKAGTNIVLDLFRSQDTIDQREREERGNACDYNRNLAADAGHIVLKILTISIRAFTNESYEEFMAKGGKNNFCPNGYKSDRKGFQVCK
ncbi:MAG: hypothetical protein SGJ18_05770 [Pseudomonadota bacterium]|nr:hypothetical protein [Pseudomonadota bacterium]